MHILKKTYEDFIVEEVYEGDLLPQGKFLIVKMKKTNWNTTDAVHQIALRLRIPTRSIGYSGLKDKHGITSQHISFTAKRWQDISFLKIKDIELSLVGYSDTAITLGSCQKNRFQIVVRNLEEELSEVASVVNYYDEQRFGGNRPNTHIVGKLLLKKEYEKAVWTILCGAYETEEIEHQEMRANLPWPDIRPQDIPHHLRTERTLVEFLSAHPGQYKEALLQVPKRLLTLYVQAYQSFLFNLLLKESIIEYSSEIPILGVMYPVGICTVKELPLVGYDYKEDNPLIIEILRNEGITTAEFDHEIADIRMRTTMRETSVPVQITKGELEQDPYHPTKFCQKVSFTLPTGAYATMVIKQMVKE